MKGSTLLVYSFVVLLLSINFVYHLPSHPPNTRTHMHIHTHTQAEEFRGLVQEEHFNWVAQYLVMKRASIEPNFHSLYSGFLDVYSSHTLCQQVLRETHRNIKVGPRLCVVGVCGWSVVWTIIDLIIGQLHTCSMECN